MTIQPIQFLTFLFTMILLTLMAPHAHADDIISGASAPIPSTSQKIQNLNYDLSSPSGSRTYSYDHERFEEYGTRVQEDPDAGNRVMQQEKPVSYFKRDERTNLLPKR